MSALRACMETATAPASSATQASARRLAAVWALGLMALLGLLVFTACGGGRSSSGGNTLGRRFAVAKTLEAGPADVGAMRALLRRYSPSGDAVVTAFETLPRSFSVDRSTITLRHSGDFGTYFHDDKPENVVDHMQTAVHEVYHAVASLLGLQLLVESRGTRGDGVQAVLVGGAPVLVRFGPTYPAAEMDATFPRDARTSRYPTYVSPSQPSQSTQGEGVFGLLDEWAAYYHSGRTLVDFWPWIRDESPDVEQVWVTYTARYHEMWQPYAEFKLYILHYLLHAKDHRPDVYRALMANDSFRRAFVATDDAYVALLAQAAALEPEIHAHARSRGLDADLDDQGRLTFDGSLFRIRDRQYPALVRHLASPRYQAIAAELRRGL